MPSDADLRAIERAIARISRVGGSRTGRRRIEERSGIPLGPATIETLSAVCRLGPARVGALADDTQLHQSRVSREVAKLVEAGFVEQGVDPHDRRATIVSPTDKGLEALDRYRVAAYEGVHDLLAHWPADDVRTLAGLLNRLAEEFGTIEDPRI